MAAAREQNFAKPVGRALVVAARPSAGDLAVLKDAGLQAEYAEDPYGAMAEICRRPLAYRAVVLPLATVFREELALIGAVKKRYPHVAVYLSQTDGRQGSLAEAMRMGVDGLLSAEGIHTTGGEEARKGEREEAPVDAGANGDEGEEAGVGPAAEEDGGWGLEAVRRPAPAEEMERPVMREVGPLSPPASPVPPAAAGRGLMAIEAETPGAGEPVLTAEELRALLQDQPSG